MGSWERLRYLLERGRVAESEAQTTAVAAPGGEVLDQVHELPHEEVAEELQKDDEEDDALLVHRVSVSHRL